MLAIRLQRTGRKGHAHFRLVVQDSRRTPASGKVVAHLGHYDPHAKTTVLDKEKAAFYLDHGAQPSPRVINILKTEKVTLPKWVAEPSVKTRAIRNIEKLRRNRPAEPEAKVEAKEDAPAVEAEPVAETPADKPEQTVEPTEEAGTEATPATETAAETEETVEDKTK